MASTAAAPTIGMQIDAALSQLDSLSSTQLYALIVAVTVCFSTVLLGNAQSPLPAHAAAQLLTAPSPPPPSKTTIKGAEGPEPRWYIFRMFNYGMMAAFVWSVADFFWNYAAYALHSSVLLRFLVGWSLCLIYFFGFFGVSFVHDVAAEMSAAEEVPPPTAEKSLVATATAKSVPAPHSGNTSTPHKVVAPPASDVPVCTDKASFQAPSAAPSQVADLPDAEIAQLVLSNQMKDHELEKRLDPHRAVTVRRIVMNTKLQQALGNANNNNNVLDKLPAQPSLDYSRVYGANCEIVIGYVPLPVGLVGPLVLNGQPYYIPMATTEGCLVASTNRGAKAITAGGGAHAQVLRDGITRAPCLRCPSAMQAAQLKLWCEQPDNFQRLKAAFESTTSFGKLIACQPTVAGRNVYLRLICFSGDAMGMNMVSKGSLAVIGLLQTEFPEIQLVALSGNMCTDKKAAATNWIEGRGKSVVVEAVIPQQVVQKTLKTTVKAMVETNLNKNLIGSAMAATVGGFNAHASNIVTAIFLATGQDPAQNVESSNCITLLEETEAGDLWISCTMPSLEVGTVGGGTSLAAQATCLQAMGVKGGGANPGDNARRLAEIVAAATMAGELSLLAALAANTLVQAHMQHNRKKPSSTPATSAR